MHSTPTQIPAWFVERMMTAVWSYGLLLTDGTILGIRCIEAITEAADGTLWLDVQLMTDETDLYDFPTRLVPPSSRTAASINASHVMAAFELADS